MQMDMIEKSSDRVGNPRIASSSFVGLLAMLQDVVPGDFDANDVRVKIVMPNQDTIWIDSSGGVKHGNQTSRLSRSALAGIQFELDQVTCGRDAK